jgi:crotonobetainyl-CoA:carnitine CoA-transferase CaiB-like acyl-CoA transferase
MRPLQGLGLFELFCIGPGPFAGILLSDMGGEILWIDHPRAIVERPESSSCILDSESRWPSPARL